MRKNVIIFGADMSLPVHFDNKNKDILILADGPTHLLDDTTLILCNQEKDLYLCWF